MTFSSFHCDYPGHQNLIFFSFLKEIDVEIKVNKYNLNTVKAVSDKTNFSSWHLVTLSSFFLTHHPKIKILILLTL